MPLFFPDIVAPGDAAGFSFWLSGHYFEHQQFIEIGEKRTPPYLVADWDLRAWSDDEGVQRMWFETHEKVHESLRGLTGVQGVDLSYADPTNEGEFQIWLEFHRSEHAAIRSALGVM